MFEFSPPLTERHIKRALVANLSIILGREACIMTIEVNLNDLDTLWNDSTKSILSTIRNSPFIYELYCNIVYVSIERPV